MKLSVVIPAHNEAGSIRSTVTNLMDTLEKEKIDYEMLVVDDHSTDGTADAIADLVTGRPRLRYIESHYAGGFGFTVRAGLDAFTGDAVAVMMADGSDSPADLVKYYGLLEEGYDCAFGSRFLPGSHVYDYPRFKLAINRLVNWFIRLLFTHHYNDTTNAFKAYRREVIDHIQPLLSNHFNLTVEMPLKAVVRGFSYGVVPISWTNRKEGTSKLKLQEMGSRYLYIVLIVFLEHHLTRGDSRRTPSEPASGKRFAAAQEKPDFVQSGGRR